MTGLYEAEHVLANSSQQAIASNHIGYREWLLTSKLP